MASGTTTPELSTSDEHIASLVQSGDKNAFAVLIRRYQAPLLRYAFYIVSDEAAAADVVQESFIKAYVNLMSFNPSRQFSSWIYRIVHNQAINAISKEKHTVVMDEDLDTASDTDIEAEFVKEEEKERIQDCLHQLPIMYREPLILLYLDGKSYEDISTILRLPMGTVATRINRGKKLIRKICQK